MLKWFAPILSFTTDEIFQILNKTNKSSIHLETFPNIPTRWETKTLSEKYDVLEIYKVLAILLMIIASGSYIYSLIQFSELAIETTITTTISYIITIFSLFCLTKMIDFLFDLDNK